MDIITQIRSAASQIFLDHFQYTIDADAIPVNETKPEFEGDYTVVLFSFMKALKGSPESIGNKLGQALVEYYPGLFSRYNLIKGFLNLSVTDLRWIIFLNEQYAAGGYGNKKNNGRRVMVEYSSPNTNKPLHMGHLRKISWDGASPRSTRPTV